MTQIDWISVDDRLPGEDDGRYVLAATFYHWCGTIQQAMSIAFFEDPADYDDPMDARGWVDWGHDERITVTHWAKVEHLMPESRFAGMSHPDFISEFGDLRPKLGNAKQAKAIQEE